MATKSNKGNKKNNKTSVAWFTSELWGTTFALFSVLILLCLISGDAIFFTPGLSIRNFFLGVFGYISFPLFIWLLMLGVRMIIGFKFGAKFRRIIWGFFIDLGICCLFIQTLVTQSFVAGDYAEYLSLCYGAGASFETALPGGVFSGVLCYPVQQLVQTVGACVLYGLAFAILNILFFKNSIWSVFEALKARRNAKPREKVKTTQSSMRIIDTSSEFMQEDEPQLTFEPKPETFGRSGGFGGLNINDEFNMKDKRDYRREQESGSGVHILFADGEWGKETSGFSSGYSFNTGSSYSSDYDTDINSSADYVRKPFTMDYSNRRNSVSDASGAVPRSDNRLDSSFDADAGRVPEKTFIVDNGDRRQTKNIDAFELKKRQSDQSSMFDEADSSDGRFSSAYSYFNEHSGVSFGYGSAGNDLFSSNDNKEQTGEDKFADSSRNDISSTRRIETSGDDLTRRVEPSADLTRNGELNGDVSPRNASAREDRFSTTERKTTDAVNANNNEGGRQLTMNDLDKSRRLENPIDMMPVNYKFSYPPLSLLNDYLPDTSGKASKLEEQKSRRDIILSLLKNSNVQAEMADIKSGPTITRFEITIPPTVSIKKVLEKQEDLNLWLAARGKIRIVAPILGTTRIGIEVPNKTSDTVGLKSVIASETFKKTKKTSLSFCLGQDLVGNPIVLDISKMPHLLVAGSTGTGKSVFLNTLLISMMYKYSPDELRIIIVDPKIVEFACFKGSPFFLFDEIFNDANKTFAMLNWLVGEMERRYKMLSEVLVRNIDEYNAYMTEKRAKKLPKILVVIDEFADLMDSSANKKKMENCISRLAQKARAAGIHLVMATQRPSVDVMEGSIKTNFTSRMAFKMASQTDAQVILNEMGAEKLLGNGDVLYRTSTMSGSERAQGAFISTAEVTSVVNYIRDNNKCYYDEFALDEINKSVAATASDSNEVAYSSIESESDAASAKKANDEEIIKRSARLAITAKNISITMMQRKLGLGYPKAAKIMDVLVERNFVSEPIDNKTRKVLITPEQFKEIFGEDV